MRTLLITALGVTVVGCSCFAPQLTTMNGCTDAGGYSCYEPIPASLEIDPTPAAFKRDAGARNPKSNIAANRAPPSSAEFSKKPTPVTKRKKDASAAKPEPAPPAQVNDRADPVMEQAKASIAAKMENPASAEFGEMTRAVRKNVIDTPIDSICGYVKGKNALGEDTGQRPFVYIVRVDEAYLVDGRDDTIAATAYRNICLGIW
jgi:hypothetical protein